MATDVTAFRARFPEFSDDTEFPDARIQLFLDDTVTIHIGDDEARWGGKYNIAQAYLAAHLLTSGTNTEAGDTNSKSGPISSKSAGGVSVSRAVTVKDTGEGDDFYRGTSYGQQFILIRNRCFAGVVVANCL